MSEVRDINEERKKREEKDKGVESSPQAELFYQIALKINRDRFAPRGWTEFPRKFHLLADESGRKYVLEENNNREVSRRVSEAVTDAIVQYCYNELAAVPGSDINHRAAESCRRFWMALTEPVAIDPMALVEKSDPRLAYRRLDFDAPVQRDDGGKVIVPEIPPHFGEFISRCSQPDALCAFIGSLFYPEADRQQYVYLFGAGLDGKGAILRFLYMLLGSAAQALQPRIPGDRFWNMKIHGKRLVIFSDCEDFQFFSSPDFKCITGNDPIFFEEKKETGFSGFPTCKVIAASNFKPNISTQRSDLRRLIYVEVAPIPEGAVVPNYEQLLLSESLQTILYCKSIYERMCLPSHGPIECDLAVDVAGEAEERFISVFHQYFGVASEDSWVPGHVVLAAVEKAGIRHGPTFAKLKAAWGRHFKVSIKKTNAGIRYYGMTAQCNVGGW